MARSNTNLLIGAAVLIGGAYFLLSRKASAATPAVQVTSPTTGLTLTPQPVPGALATTSGALAATNSIWSNLTATTGPGTGFVNFPTGSQAAAGLLQWATDGSGNYYTQWAGHIYLVNVAQMDSNGNYTATQQIS